VTIDWRLGMASYTGTWLEKTQGIDWGDLETAIAEAEKVVLSPLEKRVVDNVIRTAEKEIHPEIMPPEAENQPCPTCGGTERCYCGRGSV